MTLTSGIVRPRTELPAIGYRPEADRVLATLQLHGLRRAGLAEVNAAASLQTRVDRKYLVPAKVARQVVAQLQPSHHLMSVAGRAASSYGSIYFDTPDWQAFRAHAQGRRLRWKIRTRLYLEDGLCRLELKTKDGRGATVKHGLEQPAHTFGGLTHEGRSFLAERLAAEGIDLPLHALRPGVRIDYARATLCDLEGGTRLTMDGGLVATLNGRVVRIRRDHVLIETKGGLRPSPADALLRAAGARETSVSKYSVTLATLDPQLPGHRWRPTVGRYFTLDEGHAAA